MMKGSLQAMPLAMQSSLHGLLHAIDQVVCFNRPLALQARTIQFFMPGIPMVYYNGLLAAENALPVIPQPSISHDK